MARCSSRSWPDPVAAPRTRVPEVPTPRPPSACAFVPGASALLALAARADDPKKPADPPAPKVRVTATLGKPLKPSALVTYKTVGDGKRPLALHVFRPAGLKASDRRPVLVTFHGGGWTGGDPTTQYSMADRFAKRGWVWIIVQYQLADPKAGVTPFDSVKDARSAVRYVRAHAADFGIDPDKLVANGGSADGHLAAAAAMFDDVNAAADDLTVPPVHN